MKKQFQKHVNKIQYIQCPRFSTTPAVFISGTTSTSDIYIYIYIYINWSSVYLFVYLQQLISAFSLPTLASEVLRDSTWKVQGIFMRQEIVNRCLPRRQNMSLTLRLS